MGNDTYEIFTVSMPVKQCMAKGRVCCFLWVKKKEDNIFSYLPLLTVPPNHVIIEYNSTIMYDGARLTLREGTNATIKCKSLATRPPAVITWYLDGVEVSSDLSNAHIPPHPNDSLLYNATSILNVNCSRMMHWKVLRCQATVSGISQDQMVILNVVPDETEHVTNETYSSEFEFWHKMVCSMKIEIWYEYCKALYTLIPVHIYHNISNTMWYGGCEGQISIY